MGIPNQVVEDGHPLLDGFYESLIQQSIKMYRTIEQQQGTKMMDYDRLYYTTRVPFKDDRELMVRVIKIPTFRNKNKISYYALFLCDIVFWRKGEISELWRQVTDCVDKQDVDSYTIYVFGRFHGYYDPVVNSNMKRYKIFIMNTEMVTGKGLGVIRGNLQRFFLKRIKRMSGDGLVFGGIADDICRLQGFVDWLQAGKREEVTVGALQGLMFYQECKSVNKEIYRDK